MTLHTVTPGRPCDCDACQLERRDQLTRNRRRGLRPILAGTLAAAILAGPAAGAAMAPTPHPRPLGPCANDEAIAGHPCVWDARHMGDGHGQSFVRLESGRTVHVSHRDAHTLLRWTR